MALLVSVAQHVASLRLTVQSSAFLMNVVASGVSPYLVDMMAACGRTKPAPGRVVPARSLLAR